MADLAGIDMWRACTYAKNYGCCPEKLTEDYYWRNTHAYPAHPPTLLVQVRSNAPGLQCMPTCRVCPRPRAFCIYSPTYMYGVATVSVQPVSDCNADRDAARYYHQTMLNHGGISAYLALGGSTHEISPAAFGVLASWIRELIG